jgi:hypothetical protein
VRARRGLQICTVLLSVLLVGCGRRNLSFEILYRGGNSPGSFCKEEDPDLVVVSSRDQIAALGWEGERSAKLKAQVETLDYQEQFLVVVCRGALAVTNSSLAPEVLQVSRQGDKVTVHAHFPDILSILEQEGCEPAESEPHIVVSVAKEGSWGRDIHFVLEVDGDQVKECRRFVP